MQKTLLNPGKTLLDIGIAPKVAVPLTVCSGIF
jgi:hypothetical protein